MEPYSSDDIKRKKRKNSNILNKLLGAIPEVKSAAIVSAEGLPIASALPQGVDEIKIAAMTAALFSLSEMAILEMRKGNFDQLYIKGSEGYFLVMQAGQNAVLAVSTTKDVRLGLVLLDSRKTRERISGLLGKYDDGDDDDDERFPYPFVYKPPEPPGDYEMEVQLQVNKFMNEEPEIEITCQYCGRKFTEEEMVSHNCREKP
jgi:hypothetical protein